MRWKCTKPFCSHTTCIADGLCNTEGCTNPPHPQSEGGLCAKHEAMGWREELKLRWWAIQPKPEETAAAEIQVRMWEALLSVMEEGLE
jgi:hypothetical protein